MPKSVSWNLAALGFSVIGCTCYLIAGRHERAEHKARLEEELKWRQPEEVSDTGESSSSQESQPCSQSAQTNSAGLTV